VIRQIFVMGYDLGFVEGSELRIRRMARIRGFFWVCLGKIICFLLVFILCCSTFFFSQKKRVAMKFAFF